MGNFFLEITLTQGRFYSSSSFPVSLAVASIRQVLFWSNTASTGRLSPSARVISCSTNHCLVLRSCCLLFYSSVISFPDLTVFLRRKYYYFTLMLGCLIVQRSGGSQPRLIVTQDSGIWMLRSLFTGRAFIPNLSVDKGILPDIRLKIIKIT